MIATASGRLEHNVHRYVAGVDTSTQSCKVLVIDPRSGRVVRGGRAGHPDGTEVDPQAWWRAFQDAVAQAGGLDDVAALSVGGQQHSMVCLDENGDVIRPSLLWNDTRSAQAAEALILEAGGGDRERGAAWWADAVGSVPVASLTVTKLRWLVDHEPDNAARVAAICLPHDWLTWRISGSHDVNDLITDRSEASGTGYFDGRDSTYRRDILMDALRVSYERAEQIVLPRVLSPWERAGNGDSKHDWGHVILGPGCGDNAGAALALGLKPGQAMLSLGTSGVVAAVSEHPTADGSGLVTGFSDATGRWLPLACTLNAARIIDAMASITGIGTDYQRFSDLALSVPDAGGLILTPYFEGERTPNLPDATAALTGMNLANSDRAHVARASVEGLLNLMRGALDALRRLDVIIDEVVLVGGGARLYAVQQLAGSVLGCKVSIPEPGEYVALGAARQAERVRMSAR
ncbi:xylulokinase [Cutibacterium sp. V947]|uniref:xylulokinase n=1 Tax=Cutibacterium sp. V947 TaxID=3446480 RepID=UPI003EDE9355